MPVGFGLSKGNVLARGKVQSPMILEIDTSKSAGLQYDIPFVGSHAVTIDWGDGTVQNFTSAVGVTRSRTYASAGVYQIKITGVFATIGYGSTAPGTNALKLTKIVDWGSISSLKSVAGLCSGSSVTEVPNYLPTNVNNISYLFNNCTTFNNANVSSWDVSRVTNLGLMFYGASTFNQNIGSWDLSNCTSIGQMFKNATAFNNGGSSSIQNWNTANVTSLDSLFMGSAFNQPIGSWNIAKVTTIAYVFAYNSAFNQDISGWNTANVTSMSNAFNGASSFNQSIGTWNVSNVTSFTNMFNGATAFNNGGSNTINNWNTGNVTSMNNMFVNAKAFNQPIGSWNTSKVTTMAGMFQSSGAVAPAFNQDIGSWDVSKVTGFDSMFAGVSGAKTAFNNGGNSNIGNWNVSAGTNFGSMFQYSDFNQNIGGWTFANTGTVSFAAMFAFNAAFNNGGSNTINNWNTSRVTTMNDMFNGATSFNQPVGAWNVSSVTNMYQMFFNNTVFNQPVNTWNVSNVQNFGRLFRGATSFNQSLSSWNTSSATDYFEMFLAAPSFNQPLGHFSVTQRPRMYSIFPLVSGLSTENYSRTLIGWANQIANSGNDYSGKCLDSGGAVPAKYNNINYGGSPYNNAAAARAFLVDVNSISKTNNNQRNIACSSNGLICLSGNVKGYLQKSTDGGVNWTNLTSVGTSTTSWRCVAMSADGTYMAACITSGAVYTSSDGGANWTLRSGAGNRAWGGIAISSDGTKLAAVVLPGFIYTSSDSGATWTQRGISANYNSISMSSDGTKLVTCSQNTSTNGYIFTSGDSGATWTARVTDANRSWGSCACSSDGTIMYATEAFNNTVRKSTDSGATWTSLGIAQLQGQPRAVTCSADGSRLIIVTRGSGVASAAGIGYSSNGGTSFIFQNIGTSGTNTTLKAIVGANFDLWVFAAMSDDGQRIIMRPNGLSMGCPMVYSTDTGATWNAATLTGYTGANWTVLDGGAA